MLFACLEKKEEEGLHGVFKRLRRNGHQLERILRRAQLRLTLNRRLNPRKAQPLSERHDIRRASTTVFLITHNVVVSEGM
jgi:aspartate aminotransferase-like enzyme